MHLNRRQPVSLTSFVGRKREVREVCALVKRARLATLTGPGGSGKTRLAREAARRLDHDFVDGVAIVALASLTEARLVQQALAVALDVTEQPGRPLAATLPDHLRT